MIVAFRSSKSASENIWINGNTDPTVFQPNTVINYPLTSSMQYMNHVKVNGNRVNTPTIQHNSIAIWDGDAGAWVVATP